ncbi:MAG: ATP-grasp domain-containing protein [Gammaproteobacteria bacterium]|nr:ATP-grasp domain-containing protein [Gammaproteobacteria bacterium]
MQKILVANRGEIAVRIIDTCRKMNIRSVAVFSDADRDALHVQQADEAAYIGTAPAEESYLNPGRVLQAARDTGAEGIHPGYGFLSENAEFARAVEAQGLIWIGPPPAAMEAMASKIQARDIALEHQVPVIPAVTLDSAQSQPDLQAIAVLGFPLLIKASAGGGGIGMREVHTADELEPAINEARTQAERQFGDASLLIESLLSAARHVEVQVVGDQQGKLLHLHDRDCSLQRRRQKLIEEAPAPGLSDSLRKNLHSAALRLAAAVDYHGVGTVEFLVLGEEYYLLEMNTRLQVEHGVTELVCGLDLVQLQIDIAAGRPLQLSQDEIVPQGHAIEARIYAEDPHRQFAPSTGVISAFHYPGGEWLRVDTGIEAGSLVSHHYDGLLCKLIASGADRTAVTSGLLNALHSVCIAGVTTNQRFLHALLRQPSWLASAVHTSRVEDNLADYLVQSGIPESSAATALMAATVWQFLRQTPDADRVAWPGGFQHQRNTQWELQGQDHSVPWRWCAHESFHFIESDRTLRVVRYKPEQANTLYLESNGIQRRFQFYPDSSMLTVHESSMGSVTLRQQRLDQQQDPAQNLSSCISAGPGLVLKVLVEPGQSVARGDGLVVIESMKMETTLRARCAGRVADINTTAGALVETGQLLLKLEADMEDTE